MTYEENYLAHFGIKGQRWGIRRFQNEDRTLTESGKERYYKNSSIAEENENLNDKLTKFDKLSPNEQDSVRKEARERIDKLTSKGKLGRNEIKTLSRLCDWYVNDCDNRLQKVMTPFEKAQNRVHMSQDDGQVNLMNDQKYKNLYNHVIKVTKEDKDKLLESAHDYLKYSGKRQTPMSYSAFVKISEANLKYWKNISQSTFDYVEKNFKPEERDSAMAFIIWNFFD